MKKNIKNILEEANEYMVGTYTTAAAEQLFEVSNIPQLLEKYSKHCFHTMTVKLLLLSKRVRTIIQEAVSFFITRVKVTYKYNYKKIGWFIIYWRG